MILALCLQIVAITHATVIDPGPGSVKANQTVVVRGDRIVQVGEASQVTIPASARVIDATGQYLIPGLWDMHVHSVFGDWFPGGRDVILPLYIANGVTGVRDMGGELDVLQPWRDSIAAGTLIGPRMIISGPMLDGYLADGKSMRFPSSIAVMTPDDAVRAVPDAGVTARRFHQSAIRGTARRLSRGRRRSASTRPADRGPHTDTGAPR